MVSGDTMTLLQTGRQSGCRCSERCKSGAACKTSGAAQVRQHRCRIAKVAFDAGNFDDGADILWQERPLHRVVEGVQQHRARPRQIVAQRRKARHAMVCADIDKPYN
jgi:hypothetical protein